MVDKKTTTKKAAPAKKPVAKKPAKKVEVAKKTVEKEAVVKDDNATAPAKKQEYLYGVGRRKTAVAQVRLYKRGKGNIEVNGKKLEEYFPTANLREVINSPIKVVGQAEKLDITVKVLGGGMAAQAGAIRHGIARSILLLNPNFKKPLKKAGFLTRDSRRKERKKPGLKRARKAPQWKKR